MKIKQFAAVALLGMSIGSAQAAQLEFDDTFFGDFDLQEFRFDVLSDSSVSMWSDTLTNGLDNHLTLFKHNQSTGFYDYVEALGDGAQSAIDVVLDYNTTGLNDFGVALKNGFVFQDSNSPGVSDEGKVLDLTQGTYLLVNSSQWYQSYAEQGVGTTFEEGYVDIPSYVGVEGLPGFERWSEFPFGDKTQPHAFKVFVDGDVAAVSAVPLPGAVWLFASAVAGLGGLSRRKNNIV
ncbi:VPLPA-CTERM sorting domain-containing protein [Methylomonas methanica]|uniref:Secreted protein n=1 Tax=Methylomonas methanica (strain DSM 25384 / MC09) TaxID=857087 RepID=F9ZZ71_METMM|nr:VPLPA-CTERM sorting domain-containing protein [Methylomonas methanica]AEG01097.1 protein of unknown function DUF1555 [Methylomonas methanica MC09]